MLQISQATLRCDVAVVVHLYGLSFVAASAA